MFSKSKAAFFFIINPIPLKGLLLFVFALSFTTESFGAKDEVVQDTNYVVKLDEYLHGRLYLSRKFSNMAITKRNGRNPLNFESNSNLNLGIGATYKGITLNLGYGFDFLNEEEGKGNTEYIDLQAHIYRSDKVIDVYGQIYNGLFLNNTSRYSSDFSDGFYLRPDINVRFFGVNARKVMNAERFSYSAPFVQNEIQKKSAGSLLLGAKAIAFVSQSDSSFIPYFIENEDYGVSVLTVENMRSVQIGPTVGYVHSFIVKHFFFTVAFNVGLLGGSSKYQDFDGTEKSEFQINTSASTRLALGYNSEKWYLGINVLQDGVSLRTLDNEAVVNGSAGSVVLNYVKRFSL